MAKESVLTMLILSHLPVHVIEDTKENCVKILTVYQITVVEMVCVWTEYKILLAVSVVQASLEVYVRPMLMTVCPILVWVKVDVWMELAVFSVSVILASLESSVRQTLMTVLGWTVVEIDNVWMEWTTSHVNVYLASVDHYVVNQVVVHNNIIALFANIILLPEGIIGRLSVRVLLVTEYVVNELKKEKGILIKYCGSHWLTRWAKLFRIIFYNCYYSSKSIYLPCTIHHYLA